MGKAGNGYIYVGGIREYPEFEAQAPWGATNAYVEDANGDEIYG